MVHFLPYQLLVSLLHQKKGLFLLRHPRRGARPLAQWQLPNRQLPGIYERSLPGLLLITSGWQQPLTPETGAGNCREACASPKREKPVSRQSAPRGYKRPF
jgi:hypothetical protein